MPVRRRAPALLLTLLLLGAVPLPPAEAQGQPSCDLGPVRHLSCIQALHFDPAIEGIRHNLYAIAWRPVPNPLNGLHEALIVGGIPGEFTVGLQVRSLVLLYDGVRVSRLYDKEGPQLVDVDWAPDGSYALVVSNRKAILRVEPPQPGNPSYRFSNLWDDCQNIEVLNCDEAPYYGHSVAFNPTQGYAWITGSSLLQYDGSSLSVIDPGADIAWRAIGWNGDGTRALLSALVCVDPENTGQDVPCVGNVTANKIVPGRVVHADVQGQRLCEVYTYGRFDVQKAEVNGITWAPDGTHAFVYGDDDFHGTILKFDATKGATGTNEGGCPVLTSSFSWMPVVKEEGEFNDMAFQQRTGRFWAAAGAGKELWEGNATSFLDVLGEHDITGGKGTIYYGLAWDPTGTFLLVGGFAGKLYKFVPATHPFNRVSTPKSNTMVTGEVLVAGKSFSPSQFEPVDKVEVNITGAGGSTGWLPARIDARFRSMANWSLDWVTDELAPGFYVVSSRAFVGANMSNLSNRTVQVVRSGGMAAPSFEDPPLADPDGNYSLRWTTVQGEGIIYELEEAGLSSAFTGGEGAVSLTQDFAFAGDERLLYNGTEPGFDVAERKDGQYFYRIRARSATAVSPWSEAHGVAVAIDSDGDGFSDAAETARGSSASDPTSSPDDLDGDGVPNRDDAFPYDAAESLDTDGDGVGDASDGPGGKFRLDPREFADSDGDDWGDNAERRLGANPFDLLSTPESDDDQDGCLNKDEAEAETNPKDPASGPAFCILTAGQQVQGNPTPGFEALGALAALGAALWVARRR